MLNETSDERLDTAASSPDATADACAPIQPHPTGTSDRRLDYLDGLRGAAILMVLLYHAAPATGLILPYWWNPFQIGYIGVDLFLMLSGFCLYWPMVTRPGKSIALKSFLFKRARRILPPYYAAVLIMIALIMAHASPLPAPSGTAELVRTSAWHLALIHNLHPEHLWSLASPFWSLGLECSLYIAMPLLVIVAQRRGITWALALAATVSISFRLWLHYGIARGVPWEKIGTDYAYVLCNSLPGKWVEFALGMAAASWAAHHSSVTSPLWRLPASIVLVIAGALARQRLGQFAPLTDLLLVSGLFLFVIHAAQSGAHLDITQRFMRFAPLMFLGQISYSVYLLHLPALHAVTNSPLLGSMRFFVRFGLIMLVVLPAIIAVSYVFHRLVERPFMSPLRTRP